MTTYMFCSYNKTLIYIEINYYIYIMYYSGNFRVFSGNYPTYIESPLNSNFLSYLNFMFFFVLGQHISVNKCEKIQYKRLNKFLSRIGSSQMPKKTKKDTFLPPFWHILRHFSKSYAFYSETLLIYPKFYAVPIILIKK